MEGKPWYFGLIVGLVAGGVIVFGLYKFKFEPMKQEITRQESHLRDLEDQIRRGETAQARLPQFEEKVRQLRAELDKLLTILPERRNVHQLLRRFRALAEREDFDLKRFTPGVESEREFYSEWPMTLNVDGTYHNLARFFDRVSRFRRIINVDNLRIDALRRPTGSHTISANFTAKTFVYKEPPEEEETAEGEQQ